MSIIQPLKPVWKVDEDRGFVAEQIRERVRSEDNYISAKGYPLIKSEDIAGKLGRAMLELVPQEFAINVESLKAVS